MTQINARTQQDLAATGHAVGQCPECGSYRSDGLPPVLHERGCSRTGTANPLDYIYQPDPPAEEEP